MRFILAIMLALFTSAAMAQTTTSSRGAPAFSVPYVGPIKIPNTTVGTLPTCNGSALGVLYVVTDATTLTLGGNVAAGGTNKTLVMCNGATWQTQ